MVKAIIIRGPLGIGKSTISKLVADKFDGKYYSIDDILAEHGLDKRGKNEECISKKNFIKTNELALPRIKENLENGIYTIIDGNFY